MNLLVTAVAIALQLPTPTSAAVLDEPASVTKAQVLSSCIADPILARHAYKDLSATVAFKIRKTGPVVLVVSADRRPQLEKAGALASNLRSTIENCLSAIDAVPQAVLDGDEPTRRAWFDKAIPVLVSIRAAETRRSGSEQEYVFSGDALVKAPSSTNG